MRNLEEIYDEIIAEKQALSSLSGLLPNSSANLADLLAEITATSKAAIWRLMLYITAVAIYSHEAIFEAYLQQIQAAALQAVNGTSRWYRQETLKFQLGYTLVWDGQRFIYAVDDPIARIVAYCAIQEQADGLVLIKTAKQVSNLPSPLSSPELNALTAYLNQIKFAGTIIEVVSFPADDLKLYYDVYYNPILLEADVRVLVEANINNYLANLPFDGRLNITKLTDSIQTVSGVVDPVFLSAEARYGLLPYAPFSVEYSTNAGYLKIDPAFPLSATINLIPYV
jgi:hypothetical protein